MYVKSLFLPYIFYIWSGIKVSGPIVQFTLKFWANYFYKLYVYMLSLKSSIQNSQEAQLWQKTAIEDPQ